MKVYQRLAQAFKAEGVSHVFGIMGDGNMYWYSELDKLGVQAARSAPRRRGPRHGRRLGARDAHARRRERDVRPGHDAARDRVRRRRARRIAARRVLRRASDERRRLQPALQPDAASPRRARPASCALNSPESADDVVRKAFYIAQLESRPVMLSAPMDVQQKKWEDDEPYQPSSHAHAASVRPVPTTRR